MIARFKQHAIIRARQRLQGLITLEEIPPKLAKAKVPQGRSYVCVKKMAYCEIPDIDVVPDGVARGDIIVVVVDRLGEELNIPTIMIRKSWSNSPEYANMIYSL